MSLTGYTDRRIVATDDLYRHISTFLCLELLLSDFEIADVVTQL